MSAGSELPASMILNITIGYPDDGPLFLEGNSSIQEHIHCIHIHVHPIFVDIEPGHCYMDVAKIPILIIYQAILVLTHMFLF